MKFTTVAASSLALMASFALAEEHSKKEGKYSTTITTTLYSKETHKYGKFNKTPKSKKPKSTGTHKYGKFNKTPKSKKPKSTGTHKYGKFNKTPKSKKPKSTGTHKYGKFNKTPKSKKPKSTGTHKYGKFNKTPKSKKPKSTGTHKYGKFNNTHHETKRVTVTDYSGTPPISTSHIMEKQVVEYAVENAAGPSNFSSLKRFGLTAGGAMVAGALLLL